jgi:hypothetical protein
MTMQVNQSTITGLSFKIRSVKVKHTLVALEKADLHLNCGEKRRRETKKMVTVKQTTNLIIRSLKCRQKVNDRDDRKSKKKAKKNEKKSRLNWRSRATSEYVSSQTDSRERVD